MGVAWCDSFFGLYVLEISKPRLQSLLLNIPPRKVWHELPPSERGGVAEIERQAQTGKKWKRTIVSFCLQLGDNRNTQISGVRHISGGAQGEMR